MRISEVRELDAAELSKELKRHERALMNLRFRKATLQLGDVTEVRKTRQSIARIKTVLVERQIHSQLMERGTVQAAPMDSSKDESIEDSSGSAVSDSAAERDDNGGNIEGEKNKVAGQNIVNSKEPVEAPSESSG